MTNEFVPVEPETAAVAEPQKQKERVQIVLEQDTAGQRTDGRRIIKLVRSDFSKIPPETQKLLLQRGVSLNNNIIDAEYEESRD